MIKGCMVCRERCSGGAFQSPSFRCIRSTSYTEKDRPNLFDYCTLYPLFQGKETFHFVHTLVQRQVLSAR